MRTVALAVAGLVAGFVAGIVVSEVVGIVGVLAFDRAVGIRYLPIGLAVAGAVAAPLAVRRSGGGRARWERAGSRRARRRRGRVTDDPGE
jgi:Family of unknown function (DUF5957)